MNYQALIQERADLVKEAQAIFAAAVGRDLTDAEKTRDDAINARLATLNADIARLERLRDNERAVAAQPDANATAADKARVSDMHDRREDDPKRGFAGIGEFATAVKAASRNGGYVDERLRIGAAPTGYHREASSDEGYMVPPAMRDEIMELVFDDSDLLGFVNPEPTNRSEVKLYGDETTPWGATGVQARWRNEGTQMTADRLVTEPRNVTLHELYAFVTATEELLSDAPRLNDRLGRRSAAAIRYKISDAVMNGNGVGKPLGWLASPALVTVSKESGQAADTLVAANVGKMASRIMGLSRAYWLANQDVLPQLITMTLGNQPIWTPPSTGLVNAPGGFLFGRPVRFVEQAATLGDLGDIQLVNPDGYYAVTRDSGVQFASSIHLYFDYNMQAFRWTFRFGGQPFLSGPVTPAKGASTRSHFVTLEAR